MKEKNVETFGKILISEVRDSAYEKYLLKKQGYFNAAHQKKLSDLFQKITDHQALDEIILHVIDSTLFKFLVMLEQNEITLQNEELGELNPLFDSDSFPAELWTKGGWIQKFSKYKTSLIDSDN